MYIFLLVELCRWKYTRNYPDEGAKANNIYDLSGNVNECSFIRREENYRYLLGGDYFDKGFQVYADSETYSGAYHEYNIDRVGFRNTLYIR